MWSVLHLTACISRSPRGILGTDLNRHTLLHTLEYTCRLQKHSLPGGWSLPVHECLPVFFVCFAALGRFWKAEGHDRGHSSLLARKQTLVSPLPTLTAAVRESILVTDLLLVADFIQKHRYLGREESLVFNEMRPVS